MQYRPTAAELLADIADLLDDEVLDAVGGPLQHKVRVAGNLARILEREVRLGPAADAAESERLAALLGREGTLVELRAALAARLGDPTPFDADTDRAVHAALVATTRADLAIAKPGHDDWSRG
jgi:hypothetical protein